ncbi:MAG: flagellar M-ring protein FliF [Gammaproteobacteria bacterium]|nr:flagellar M-ring protein FliF [Gammaproteobacteria bacterium]
MAPLVNAERLPAIFAGLRPLALLTGLAAAIGLGIAVVLWSQSPTYSLLYGNLPDDEVAAVGQALAAAGIPYRLENGAGALSVPQERLNEARLLLAGKGVIESGGFANLARENGFGTSQFMEGARYQHALEQELARTIASLQQVASARVHIAVARESGFVRDRRSGSASVFLQLKPARRLSSEQVTSVVNLVASSLPDLEADRVTVVDQQGRLLSSPRGRDPQAMRDQQIEFARQFEESYSQRVENLLAPLVGVGRVRAQVSAEFDMSASEEAREQYKPDSQVVRREQSSEDRRVAGTASGVPGSLSNQPPSRAASSTTPADGTALSATTPQSTQSSREYEIDRTVAYTQQPSGRLKRLSVAVLIDHVPVDGRDGKAKPVPLDAAQIARIETLVKDAVGFDDQRGDRVTVVNSPWSADSKTDDKLGDTIPLWQQPWVRDAAKLLLGAILALVLLLMVVRPLLRQYAAIFARDGRSEAPNALALMGAGDEEASAVARVRRPAYDEDVARARTLVNEDPARVAQVVRKWVTTDGG